MEVATSSGEVLSSSQCFYMVEVEVAGWSLPVDLRVLRMSKFDVILGVD